MKKLLILLTILFIFPFAVFASDVKITNVEIIDKSQGIDPVSTKYNGLSTDLDFKANNVADTIKYKITIQNDSKNVFNINLNKQEESNKYFDYKYTGDTKIDPGKAGSITIETTYAKSLEKADLDKGDFISKAVLNITSSEAKNNPETGFNFTDIIIYGIACALIGFYIYNKVTNKSQIITYILLPMLLMIPLISEAKAGETLVIRINSTIVNKPFIFNYVQGFSDDVTHYGDIIDNTRIKKIEIPQKYNTYYGTDPFEMGASYSIYENTESFLPEDKEITSIKDILDLIPIIPDGEQNTITDNPKAFATYKETPRVMIYTIYVTTLTDAMKEYLNVENEYIPLYTYEYNKETKKYYLVGNNVLSSEGLVEYLLFLNREEITVVEEMDGMVYKFPNGDSIPRENINGYIVDYAKGIESDFLIINEYGEKIIRTKEGIIGDNRLNRNSIFATKDSENNYNNKTRTEIFIKDNIYASVILTDRDRMVYSNDRIIQYNLNLS